jgi:hypothetical protein
MIFRTISAGVVASCLIGEAVTAQMTTEKPIIRDNECLATYNEVYFGLEWISVSEYLSRYWNDQINNVPTIYSQDLREKSRQNAQASADAAQDAESTYQIFRKTNNKDLTIFIEFSEDNGFIGKKVVLDSIQGSEKITHNATYENTLNFSYTQMVEISWLRDEFTYQQSGVAFSDDEITGIYSGGKWKGILDCSN